MFPRDKSGLCNEGGCNLQELLVCVTVQGRCLELTAGEDDLIVLGEKKGSTTAFAQFARQVA